MSPVPIETAEQHRDRTGHTVLITADGNDQCCRCETVLALGPVEPVRPVEDWIEGPTPTAEAAHRERMEQIKASADHHLRTTAQKQVYDAGFVAGVRVGRVEAEVDHLNQEVTHELGHTEPSTYDAAETALYVAGRLLKPVDLPFDDDAARSLAMRRAIFITHAADELVRWLSEHIERDGDSIDGDHFSGVMDEPRWATTPAPVAVDSRCPECRAGKCGNCPGEVLTVAGIWDECPCPDDAHKPGGRTVG